ncbi:MAG: preprotein translocase subunit SecA [Candidatus Glassbacteria bacterium GWA2_58_10]|uniref:Protein translocase subunit SecA n=1 Tax=Candidatus Glassbacteria bacterium GWA2_58_10 TaxID=1817865 RepID=A0A1F5YGN8_9BACT|nr:MAG: preprotein translocase subunit SecA [Candidatus Glassbacteria bacterium GWA2_58_10]
MINRILKIFLGNKHEREKKKILPLVAEINRIYATLESLTTEELLQRSLALKERIGSIEDLDEQDRQCDAALPEAFALVKDACRRNLGRKITVCGQPMVWDMVPYDVQSIGAVVLHQGKIAEMATGEGKTLVAVMPMYLNALKGRGVHLVTVNDYLARRDSEWMGTIFTFLGLTVGCIQHDMEPAERKVVYRCDITYGTNNEFGFDYLRDNMSLRLEDRVQRVHHYAIVDEVDSVLIDEARTPLIISGAVQGSAPKFMQFKPLVEDLVRLQVKEVNNLIAEAADQMKRAEEEPDDKKVQELNYEAGTKLLQASRGMPKNKRLLKLLNEIGAKKLLQRVESDALREKKMQELDEALYFSMDEKGNQVQLTDKGLDQLNPNDPNMFVIPDLSIEINEIESDKTLSPARKAEKIQKVEREYLDISDKIQTIHQLLKAYILFEKDVEYVVQEGKVLIVDEFTGRLMPGRRFSEGLHQALEAKEGVKVEGETQTLATITLQNYFRLYRKLAGMTGTAETEADEFWQIYKLDVVVIPTHKPVVRKDKEDMIYRTRREKFNAIIEEVARLYEEGRPVLVGTVSVEVSETLSRMLKRRGVRHNVLNAKYHQQEAEIVAKAGQKAAVTIATNMAGRGTDIKLGEGVVELGGLAIVGTERHEARRIDRQLRGRSGRQGDPGSSEFYLSLEDSLMRLFGSERIAGVMDRLGLQEGEVITHSLVSRSIGRAQKKVEGNNFQIRKHLLEYDDVMNQQREVIYDMRLFALEGKDMDREFKEMIDEAVKVKLDQFVVEGTPPEEWDLRALSTELLKPFLLSVHFEEKALPELTAETVRERVQGLVDQLYEIKCKEFGTDRKDFLMQQVMMRVIDDNWREHLYLLDHLKAGINFRAYGQKDPLIEYKREAFDAFVAMLNRIKQEIAALFFKAQFIEEAEIERRRQPEQLAIHHATISAFAGGETLLPPEPGPQKVKTVRHDQPKIGRNDPCYCGSGKKFKHCHGREL